MCGHLAISASLPSGRGPAVAARKQLSSLLARAGTLPSFEGDNGTLCPSVFHLNEGACRFRPDALYVGSVTNVVDVSPWSLPMPKAIVGDNAVFLLKQNDLKALLWPLRNKYIVCDCTSFPRDCWALMLQATFCNVFSADPSNLYLPEVSPANDVEESWGGE